MKRTFLLAVGLICLALHAQAQQLWTATVDVPVLTNTNEETTVYDGPLGTITRTTSGTNIMIVCTRGDTIDAVGILSRRLVPGTRSNTLVQVTTPTDEDTLSTMAQQSPAQIKESIGIIKSGGLKK